MILYELVCLAATDIHPEFYSKKSKIYCLN